MTFSRRIQLRQPLIDIPKRGPFVNDKLRRETHVRNLSKLVLSARTPCVLAIDAPWGSGKTTFANMLRVVLETDGVHSVWLNAWQEDFSGDPLMDLLTQMNAQIRPRENRGKKALKVFASKGLVIAKSLSTKLPGIVLQSDPVGAALLQSTAEVAIDSAECRIAKLGHVPADLASFRESLCKLTEALVRPGLDSDDLKLVFFIDELDRCRPSYAVEMMECVKHLFDVNGIAFILSLDMAQLACMVRNLYGIETRTEGYLGKMIDFTYRLPEPDFEEYAKHLYEVYGFTEFAMKRQGHNQSEVPYAMEFLSICGALFNLSLRDMEKCFALLRVLLHSISPEERILPTFAAFMVVLRHQKRELYYDYIQGKVEWTEVWELLESQPLYNKMLSEGETRKDHFIFLKAFLRCARLSSREIGAKINELRHTTPQTPDVELEAMTTVAEYSAYGPIIIPMTTRLEILDGLD